MGLSSPRARMAEFGRRARLRISCRKASGFESRFSHHGSRGFPALPRRSWMETVPMHARTTPAMGRGRIRDPHYLPRPSPPFARLGGGVSYTLTDRVREFHVKTEEEAQQKNRFASRGCGLVSPGLPSLTEQERIVTKVERSLLAAEEFERQIEINLNW